MDDLTLIRQYAQKHCDQAFEELVRRYVNLVYSSALRQTEDVHMAEDTTQAVFLIFTRKAPSLPPATILASWFLSTTRLTASNFRRGSRRRHRLAHEVASMALEREVKHDSDPEWQHVAPLLDDALGSLSESDRAAVALRFFQRHTLSEVGVRLGISADAAEKRVARAVEKLRRFFNSRGVKLSALGLTAMLAGQSVHAAPAVFAAALPQAIAAATAGVVKLPAVAIAEHALRMIAMQKIKYWAVCALVFLTLGAAGGIFFERRRVAAGPTQSAAPASPAGDPFAAPIVRANDDPPFQARIERVPEVPPVPEPPRIDLLARINPTADAVNGTWKMQDGTLIGDRTCFSRLEIPYVPPEEYDFHVTFTVLEARNDIGMICSHKFFPFLWKMGSWNNRVSAIEINEPNGELARIMTARMFESGKRYDALVQIRNDSFTAFLNGRQLARYAMDYHELSISNFWALGGNDKIGIGSNGTPLQFHSIEVAEVRGHGTFLRENGAAGIPKPRPQLAPDESWQAAVNLLALIDPQRDGVSGKWTKGAAGELVCDPGFATRLEIPYQPPEEYDFKIVFSRESGRQDVDQIVGRDGKSLQWIIARDNERCGFQLWSHEANGFNNPATAIVPDCLKNGAVHTSIVQVRKRSFCAFLDGELVSACDLTSEAYGMLRNWTMPTPGLLGVGSTLSVAKFHSIQLLEINGQGHPSPANPYRPPAEPELTSPTAAPAPVLPPKPPTSQAPKGDGQF